MNAELIDFFVEFMPDAMTDCAGCTRKVEIGKAIRREGKLFHSEACADRETAVMVKPQEKGMNYEGWMI